MAYVDPNFKTKKALKDAVAAGQHVMVFSTMFPVQRDGEVSVEGPHYPAPHTWYARVTVENGVVKSVR